MLRVLALARFAHPKRIDLLVEAFSKINFATLFIVGNGPDFHYWYNYIAEKITNISLMGEVPSFSTFNEYDVFMLISDSEGLPISAIEAMSAGLPLILSNVGGCAELINDNGVLINNIPKDIETVLQAIYLTNYTSYMENSLKYYNELFNLKTQKKPILIFIMVFWPCFEIYQWRKNKYRYERFGIYWVNHKTTIMFALTSSIATNILGF